MAAPRTTDEWLPLLTQRLDERKPRILRLRSYADGAAPLPEGRKNLQESWKAFQKKARTNFGGLAVETVASRMIPLGVTVGDDDESDAAAVARRIWRDNRMRVQVKAAIRDRLTCSIGYLLVDVDESGRSVVTRERPEMFIADTHPLTPWRARAAVKVWRDSTTGLDWAQVWAEDGAGGHVRQRYVRRSTEYGVPRTTNSDGWAHYGEPVAADGAPPVVVMERQDGMGLFEPHIDLIDRINLGKLNRLVITAYQAFRQRAIKPYKDGESLPTEDPDGNQIDWASILEPAPGAMWDIPVPIDIWESQPTDIGSLLQAEKEDARDFAAVLRLPISVFTPEGANQSATGAAVAKEGLVSTAEDEIADVTAGIAVAMVYALRLEGVEIENETVEIQWEPAAYVSLGEKFGAAASMGLKLSRRTIMRDVLGMSRDQILQDESDLAAEMLQASFLTGGVQNDAEPSAK